MAPVNNKDTYEDSLPWDPLWEFVLGSDDEQPKKRSLFARKEPETQESFMDYWFSSGDEKELKPTKSIDLKKSSSGKGLFGSRRQSKPDDESSFFSAPSSFSKEDERHERSTSRGSSLWRRTRSPEEEDSIIGFLDQPYEITEKEYLRKQKKENKKKAREESKARSKAESSSKKHKKTSKGTRIGSFSKRSESKKMKSDDDSWVSGLSLESLGLSGKKKKRSGPFAGWKKRRQDKKTVKENVQKSTATSARSQRQRPAKDDYTEGPSLIESFTEAFDPWGETHEESESSEYETSVYSEEEGEDDDGTTTSYESSYRSEATSSVYTEESGMVAAPAISTPASAFTRAISPQRTQSSANYQYTNEVRLKYQPKASERSATRPSTRGATLFDEDKTTEESVTTATTSVSREPTSVPRERDERSQEAPVTASEVPDSLPKSKPNSVFDEDSIYNLGRHRGVGRIVCCSVKNLGDRASIISQETGLPIHELTKEQLAEIFPKVRSISETAPMMRGRSRIIGNSNSFERDLPAHVQALVAENGPQSLYEYEFEKGTHKVVLYNKFGTDPRSLLKVHTSELPPILFEQSLQTMNKVIVQVEVCTKYHEIGAKRVTNHSLLTPFFFCCAGIDRLDD